MRSTPSTHTRTHGANARAPRWDEANEQEYSQASKGRGNWLPLDDLDDELFTGTPQLHAVAAPQRNRTAPRPRPEWLQPTAPQPRQPQIERSRTNAESPAVERGVPARHVAMLAGAALTLVALYVLGSMAVEWVQVKLDDLQYGRPRTVQMDAYVGHSEAEGVPSHFIAMNLNRRVTILELPGGDSTKATTIVGPYLFGHGEDLTPVQLNARDVNSDGSADLVVSVKNEQLIYLNDGSSFRLITPEERATLQKRMQEQPIGGQTGKAPAQSGNDAGAIEEAGK